MKIVVNKCSGLFRLSKVAYEFLGKPWDGDGYDYNDYDMRTDPDLIECVEALGAKANGFGAELEISVWPDETPWDLLDQDGYETVVERKEGG